MGKWDESMYCIVSDDASKLNSHISRQSVGATLLWEKNEPPADPTRYNLSSFAITLNELTPGLKVDIQHAYIAHYCDLFLARNLKSDFITC
jgi:hypothetical protein